MDEKSAMMEALRQTLYSRGWKDIIEPTIAEWRRQRIEALVRTERDGKISDDTLRGQINMLEFVLTTFRKRLAEYDADVATEKQLGTPEPPPIGTPYDHNAQDNLG